MPHRRFGELTCDVASEYRDRVSTGCFPWSMAHDLSFSASAEMALSVN